MINKWTMIAGVTATIICLSAEVQATPVLTISDNNSHSYAASGGYLFPGYYDVQSIADVTVGNWTVTYDASVMDFGLGFSEDNLLFGAQYNGGSGGSGNALVVKWTFDSFGAFANSYSELVGGTIDSSITSAKFSVLVNGSTFSCFTQLFTSPGGFNNVPGFDGVNAAAGSPVTFEVDLSANGSGGPITFSQFLDPPSVSVPDGGVTMLLLGAALSVLGLARKLQMA